MLMIIYGYGIYKIKNLNRWRNLIWKSVREPLKYVMLLGIVMMLCGGLLLFLAGPDKQMSKSVNELVD